MWMYHGYFHKYMSKFDTHTQFNICGSQPVSKLLKADSTIAKQLEASGAV